MKYTQLTSEERYMLSKLKWQRFSQADIARLMGRSPSTISRELRRNATTHDGAYRPDKAIQYTQARRRRSRRNRQFDHHDFRRVINLLKRRFSPEQISAVLRKRRQLTISTETIYAYLREDRRHGGTLYRFLRQAGKQRRKRYRSRDSRGKLRHKRSIHERPPGAVNRSRIGHWEGDTVMGSYQSKPCILTLVDRKTGFLMIGKLDDRTTHSTNQRLQKLIARAPGHFKTITVDNGTEFHGYKDVEKVSDAKFYFADPYHSWQRATNENTNGLIRQYLPKGVSMEQLSQHQCNAIADEINNRPRKRYAWKAPAELFPCP